MTWFASLPLECHVLIAFLLVGALLVLWSYLIEKE